MYWGVHSDHGGIWLQKWYFRPYLWYGATQNVSPARIGGWKTRGNRQAYGTRNKTVKMTVQETMYRIRTILDKDYNIEANIILVGG